MCGLAALARLGGGALSPVVDATLSNMARALTHRGPDADERLRRGPVGMVFTRLALVDPEDGTQPLVSPDGTVTMIVNGEVYNYRELAAQLPPGTKFRTGSDCEVLIHLYQRDGLNFLDKIRGMFGLILWDERRNRVVLARDRFGIKPLFFHQNRNRVVASSEIKTLFCDAETPRELNWQQVLGDQAITGDAAFETGPVGTWFTGVESVPAATIIEIDLADGGRRQHQYWSLPTFDGRSTALSGVSDSDIIGRFSEGLSRSITECATADVGVGVFLSGGVDSAVVAAIASKTAPDLRTFTVLNGATLDNGDAEAASRLGDSLGLNHHQVLIDGNRTPDPDEWMRLLWLTEMPQCGPEQFLKHELHRYVAAEHPSVKAMLLGGAADEYLGGYSAGLAPDGTWGGFIRTAEAFNTQEALRSRPRLIPWWDGEFSLLKENSLHLPEATPDAYARFVQWKMRDVQQYNCWHEDRTAAGSGIEARVPFLAQDLVELTAAIPKDRRESLLWDKRMVREAVKPWLPEAFAQRPKVPFYHGDGVRHARRMLLRMLSMHRGELIERATATASSRRFLDVDQLRHALAALHSDPRNGHVEKLLRVVNMGLLETMLTDLPLPHAESTPAPVARRFDVTNWDAQREEIRTAVIPQDQRVSADSVLSWSDRVQHLKDARGGDTEYVLIDGAIEFVIDAQETPHWSRLLAEIDGTRTLQELVHCADWALEEALAELEQAVTSGVFIHTPTKAHAGV
ncbi:asparagine synthase (glutamine-hydrolyzing) [Streptomyces rubiginosohelvolus]